MNELFPVVKYLCERSNWTLTNLKLQKILYISQMMYMGQNNGERLVNTSFEALDYGPVSNRLYHKVKAFGAKPIPNIFKNVNSVSDESLIQYLDQVIEYLLPMSPGELVAITHDGIGAWAKNYELGMQNITIPDSDIVDEYRSRFQTQAA